MERSGGVLSAWGAAAAILPSQPFVQDSSMPLPTPPNPTTQLEEAKRRLETQSAATPVKSKWVLFLFGLDSSSSAVSIIYGIFTSSIL